MRWFFVLLLCSGAWAQATPEEGYQRYRQAVQTASSYSQVFPTMTRRLRSGYSDRNGPLWLQAAKQDPKVVYKISNKRIQKQVAVLEVTETHPAGFVLGTFPLVLRVEEGGWKVFSVFPVGTTFESLCQRAFTKGFLGH